MATKSLTLSIVIPAYNEEHHLKACLESIAAQTEKPDEVIVVDNNSTDGTVEVARQFSFVRVLHEKRRSVLYARTKGFSAVHADLIGRIDADTILPSDWIVQAKKPFENPDIHAVTGPVGGYDTPFPRLTLWAHDGLLRIAIMLRYYYLNGSNMVLRTTSWQKVAPEICDDVSLFEDNDIAIHMQRNGMTPVYRPRLRAMISARRAADSIPDFLRYMRRHSRTFSVHKERNAGVYYAAAAYAVAYLITLPIHRLYDPMSQKFTVKHLWKRPEKRANPMNGYLE